MAWLWAVGAWAADPEARARKADAWADAARVAYEQGDDAGAMAKAAKALRFAPEHVQAHFFQGEALARRCSGQPCAEADLERMFTSFELVARQDPTGVFGGLARGVLAALRPPPGGAPLAYEGPSCPADAVAAFEQAEAAFAEARLEVALERYTAAAAACPAHPMYEVWRGDALYGLRRFDEAAAAYTHALELEPCYWVAHRFLADTLLAKGDARGAFDHAVWSVACNPTYAEGKGTLGSILTSAGGRMPWPTVPTRAAQPTAAAPWPQVAARREALLAAGAAPLDAEREALREALPTAPAEFEWAVLRAAEQDGKLDAAIFLMMLDEPLHASFLQWRVDHVADLRALVGSLAAAGLP